jgi:hypothetical protein
MSGMREGGPMSGMRDHTFGCNCRSHVGRLWHRPEHWTSRDVAYLERAYGRVSDDALAQRLHRSVVGVRLKAKRMGLRKKDAGYTARHLARELGIDASTVVKSWIRRGLLRSLRSYRVGAHLVHIISEAEVERFIREHGEWIDHEKVPADSGLWPLVATNRWYSTTQLHRLTGRLRVKDECRLGLIAARRAGAHWKVPESELPKIRRLLPEQIAESVWRRASVLAMRRKRRRTAA